MKNLNKKGLLGYILGIVLLCLIDQNCCRFGIKRQIPFRPDKKCTGILLSGKHRYGMGHDERCKNLFSGSDGSDCRRYYLCHYKNAAYTPYASVFCRTDRTGIGRFR